MATRTTNFGVGKRESHDASVFYARFASPELSDDVVVNTELSQPDPACILGDSRDMRAIPNASVALVVTSPPYFAGKEYEEALGEDGVPGSYREYLQLLRDVFAECKRVLEPGGRIAVNVANLGRKPYRSLSADVINILQDDLRLLLRGEVIWRKQEGAGGNCAWGSFRSAANPVLRDLTERVIIASKGRFDRAVNGEKRKQQGLPHESSLSSDEFMEATIDVWEMLPESAKRVNHPAPFPVELPERLINLYTYKGDLVLDPFMGSGTTLVAASRAQRRYVGYDAEAKYVEIARSRLATEVVVAQPSAVQSESIAGVAQRVLEDAGFTNIRRDIRLRGLGMSITFEATDSAGGIWLADVTGGFTTTRTGLAKTDTLMKCLGRAHVVANNNDRNARLLLLTSYLPRKGTDGDRTLRAVGPRAVFDAIEILSDAGQARLRAYATGNSPQLPGYWTEKELSRGSGDLDQETSTSA